MDLGIKVEMKEATCGEIIGLVLYLTDKELSRTVDGWDPAPKAWEIRRNLSRQNVTV